MSYEKDKAIADFMNKKVYEAEGVLWSGSLSENTLEPVNYSTSLDALAPVVIKITNIIEQKMHELSDYGNSQVPEKDLDDPAEWRAWSYRHIDFNPNANDVYEQVYEFITWYNQV